MEWTVVRRRTLGACGESVNLSFLDGMSSESSLLLTLFSIQ